MSDQSLETIDPIWLYGVAAIAAYLRRPGRGAERDCSWRWKREGRRVRIARPPKGMEVDDLLVGGAPSPMRGAR